MPTVPQGIAVVDQSASTTAREVWTEPGPQTGAGLDTHTQVVQADDRGVLSEILAALHEVRDELKLLRALMASPQGLDAPDFVPNLDGIEEMGDNIE